MGCLRRRARGGDAALVRHALHHAGPDRDRRGRADQRHGGTHPSPPGPADRDDHRRPARHGGAGRGRSASSSPRSTPSTGASATAPPSRRRSYSVDLATTRFRRPRDRHRRARRPGRPAPGGTRPLRALPCRAAGSIGRSARWWDRALHQVEVPGAKTPEGYQVLYRSPAGAPEGYVRYRATQSTDSMRSDRRAHRRRARGRHARRLRAAVAVLLRRRPGGDGATPVTGPSTSSWDGSSRTAAHGAPDRPLRLRVGTRPRRGRLRCRPVATPSTGAS